MSTNVQPDFTVQATCEYLAISKPTFYKLVGDSVLQVYKVGRGTRVTRESIEALRNGRRAAV